MKHKEGKLRWIDVEPFLAVTVIGLIVTLIGPSLPFFLSFIGLILLIISKISLFRRGIWFSFGPKLMSREYARLYKLSYILIGVGFLLMLLIAIRI